MKTNCVITIGRQFGSGGRYVGRMLAEKLGIPFYDKELLSEAAKQSGICEEIFEDHDEKPTRSCSSISSLGCRCMATPVRTIWTCR